MDINTIPPLNQLCFDLCVLKTFEMLFQANARVPSVNVSFIQSAVSKFVTKIGVWSN